MKLALLLSLLSFGVATGAGIWLHSENAALQERLAALEALPAGGPDAVEGTKGAPSAGLRGAAVRRDVAELRRLTSALTDRMGTLERSAAEAPGASSASGDVAAWAGKPAFTEAVRDVVLDMASNDVDFRARVGVADRTKIPKNAPFATVAETLKLDATQEAQMSKDLQEMQGELFALLSEERTDGIVPLELIAKSEELKQGDPKRAETFMKLFTLKVPGGEETYMQRAVKLGGAFRKRIEKFLRAEQVEILNAVEIDWFSIKFD